MSIFLDNETIAYTRCRCDGYFVVICQGSLRILLVPVPGLQSVYNFSVTER